MLTRSTILQASVVVLATAALASACTTILGDDFEIGPAGSGAHSQGGDGAHSQGGDGGIGAGGGTGGHDPLCGNDQPDPGELCDGDCPTECMDADLCSSDRLDGSPLDCNSQCLFEQVTTCVRNDGCCPNGCYYEVDNDCGLRVLIVSSDGNGAPEVQSALFGFGVFGVVDTFDAWAAVPSLDLLMGYDAVLVYAKYQGFADPFQLGNDLADYHDNGGRVVVANGANCNDYALAGRFVNDEYLALGFGDMYPVPDFIGNIDLPDTPLFNHLDVFLADAHCNGPATPGSTVLAHYQDSGDPVVAYRWVGDRRRVDLNVFPSPPYDVLSILVDALLFQ